MAHKRDGLGLLEQIALFRQVARNELICHVRHDVNVVCKHGKVSSLLAPLRLSLGVCQTDWLLILSCLDGPLTLLCDQGLHAGVDLFDQVCRRTNFTCLYFGLENVGIERLDTRENLERLLVDAATKELYEAGGHLVVA